MPLQGWCKLRVERVVMIIGNINPFRWKGHYFDTESGLYYANGSYYDPEVGLHVDAMPVSSLIENAFKVFCDFRLNNKSIKKAMSGKIIAVHCFFRMLK